MNQATDIKIYTEEQWAVEPPRRAPNFLAPLLFKPDEADTHGFPRWENIGSSHLSRVDHPAEATLICLPDLYTRISPVGVKQAAHLADRYDKPLLLMEHCDHYASPVASAQNTFLFHSDLYRSRKKANQHVHPTLLIGKMLPLAYLPEEGWWPYPWESHIRVFWRGAGGMQSLPAWKRTVFHAIDNWRRIRHEALLALLQGPDVTLVSTLSNHWWEIGLEEQDKRKRLFVKEALEAPYALIVRGSGNYSFRLYEIMALGRVPIIIDTDSCLPWPDRIPWQEISLIVPRRDIPSLPARLRAFHESFTPESFEALQLRIRNIWQTYLSEPGFYTTLTDTLPNRPNVLHERIPAFTS